MSVETDEKNDIEKLARDRLIATKNDGWSYIQAPEALFRYCPWTHFQEFDGTVDGLTLPWPADRRRLINKGALDPSPTEFMEWQRAMSLREVEDPACQVALLVAVEADGKLLGYALFIGNPGDAVEDEPLIEGIFESDYAAEAHLRSSGSVLRIE